MKTQSGAAASKPLNQAMGVKEWCLVTILSILWGGSFFFVGVAVEEIPPLTIVHGRVTLAAILLLAVVWFRGEKLPSTPALWRGLLIMGALNNLIPFGLIVWGQTHIDSGLASILNGTTPIFSAVLAHFLTKEERLTPNRLSGVLIGWAGVAVLMGMDSLRGFGIEILSRFAILGAAFSYACAAIFGRRFKGLSPLVVATGMLCGSAIMITPLALWVDRPWNISPGGIALTALVGLAAISTSLAYLIYFKILASAGPTNLLLVTFLIPLSAILLGALVLEEQLAWNAFAGMGLIFIGLLTIDGRMIKK